MRAKRSFDQQTESRMLQHLLKQANVFIKHYSNLLNLIYTDKVVTKCTTVKPYKKVKPSPLPTLHAFVLFSSIRCCAHTHAWSIRCPVLHLNGIDETLYMYYADWSIKMQSEGLTKTCKSSLPKAFALISYQPPPSHFR